MSASTHDAPVVEFWFEFASTYSYPAAMRVEAAAGRLVQSSQPLKRIAAGCGFGSEQNLRRAFERSYGVLPLDYRARFAAA